MLRIAAITRYYPSSAEPWQGRSAYQTLRVLAREADVRVFYPHARYPALLKPRGRSDQTIDANYSTPDVGAGYFSYFALPLLSRPFNGWMSARALLPAVRAFAPDLIFSCFLYPDGFAAIKIGKALAVPVVAMSIGSDINRIDDFITAMHTRKVLCEADCLVTVSEDLRRKAITMGASAETTRAIPNGCDLAVFHPADRLDARRKLNLDLAAESLVYIGRIDRKKGLRELVEAAVLLRARRANLHTYLIGEGPDRPLIARRIQDACLADYIHLLPACAFDDVAVWMAAADLVTLPSYMEGCPNVVLEALACGRPVVATNVGGIPEILNDECGQLVAPRDSGALARVLASVLDKSWNANAIAARGSRSWETVAAELREVFDSLISTRRSG